MRLPRGPLFLSHRIVVTVVIGLGLVLLVAGALALWTIQGSIGDTYGDRVSLAQQFAQRINDVLEDRILEFQRTAADLTLVPGRPLTASQEQQLGQVRGLIDGLTQLSVSDAQGTTLWIDPESTGGASTQPASQPGLHRALQTGQPVVTTCATSPPTPTALACLAVPLRDPQGKVAGVLLGEFDPAHLSATSLLGAPGRTGVHVELIDRDGHDLMGSKEYFPGATMDHEALLGSLIASGTAGYRIHNPPVAFGMPSHIVAYAPVPALPAWGVLLEEPKDNVLALQNRLAQRLGLLAIATLVLGTLVAWLDVRRVVRPLRQLTAAAERFARGDLDEPIHLGRRDELGVLAGAFESMRGRLRASLAEVEGWNRELERRVTARTAEAEARNRELQQLNALAETVGGSLDLRTTLDRALDRILDITGAETGCFLVPNDLNGRLELVAARPETVRAEVGRSCPADCLCGRALRGEQPIIVGGDGGSGILCPVLRASSCLAMPLPAGERVQGSLLLGSTRPSYFQEHGLTTLSAIGRQVGMALANARLYQDLQARERERAELLQRVMNAQEEDRRRLAQELHDETSQALTSLRLGLERLGNQGEASSPVRELATQLQGIAATTLAEVHRLAVELRPNVLDDLGLVSAVERYLQECGQRSGIGIDFAAVGIDGLRLQPAAETALYRIAQGALTNVIQHAEAAHVSVLLKRRGDQLVLIVEDDGRGFDLAAVHGGSLETRLGLAGMDERTELLSGTLTIETTPGAGTTVFVEIPLDLNCPKEVADGAAADRAG